jgi:hypothetical protein
MRLHSRIVHSERASLLPAETSGTRVLPAPRAGTPAKKSDLLGRAVCIAPFAIEIV